MALGAPKAMPLAVLIVGIQQLFTERVCVVCPSLFLPQGADAQKEH